MNILVFYWRTYIKMNNSFYNQLLKQRLHQGIRKLGIFGLLILFGVAHAVQVTGLVYPLHDLVLSASVSGVVLVKNVLPGQKVAARQLLVSLDDRMQSIEVERRKVILNDHSELDSEKGKSALVKSLLDAAQNVYDKTGSISTDELTRLKAEYVVSKGKYGQLLAQKQREEVEYRGAEKDRTLRHVYAPVVGVITKLSLEPGEYAKQGEPLVHMVDAGTCIIKFAIPLKDSTNVHMGSQIPVTLLEENGEKNIIGKISFISPVADPASGLVEAKITFNNAILKVKPGIKAIMTLDSKLANH